jgi:hypothetical protein
MEVTISPVVPTVWVLHAMISVSFVPVAFTRVLLTGTVIEYDSDCDPAFERTVITCRFIITVV